MKQTFLCALIIICCSFLSKKREQPDRIVLLIDQAPFERPLANTIETFWHDKQYFDTIQITGKALVAEINQTFASLKAREGSNEISYEACIIRYSKNKAIDTFYSWRWLNYWKKGSTMYVDTSRKFEAIFGKMFHGE